MELTGIKKRLMVATKGHKLLKDKRDEMMRQFLDMVRETKVLREEVEKKLMTVNQSFALASSLMQREAMVSALMLPKQSVKLDISEKNVMGVKIPVFDFHANTQSQSDTFSYGYAFTSGDLDSSSALNPFSFA